jgi:hypothetical protein
MEEYCPNIIWGVVTKVLNAETSILPDTKYSHLIKLRFNTFKGGLTILKELKIAHHENSVPKKDFFPYFSTLIFDFKAKSDIEK